MKKLVLFAFLAVSMLATARTTQKPINPLPGCQPCDFVHSTAKINPLPVCQPCDFVRSTTPKINPLPGCQPCDFIR
jgi:hypothetical protein